MKVRVLLGVQPWQGWQQLRMQCAALQQQFSLCHSHEQARSVRYTECEELISLMAHIAYAALPSEECIVCIMIRTLVKTLCAYTDLLVIALSAIQATLVSMQ